MTGGRRAGSLSAFSRRVECPESRLGALTPAPSSSSTSLTQTIPPPPRHVVLTSKIAVHTLQLVGRCIYYPPIMLSLLKVTLPPHRTTRLVIIGSCNLYRVRKRAPFLVRVNGYSLVHC